MSESIQYAQGENICIRSLSPVVLTAVLDIPPISARLNADWERDMASQLCLKVGDVEKLSLARARQRWPEFNPCIHAITSWTQSMGLQDALSSADMALMACRGARYHNDVELYGSSAFCNLFLSEDKGLDLHFPDLGLRMPLNRGTAVIFDTGQTHAVIKRNSHSFDASDFPQDSDCSLVFLTWELLIEHPAVAHALQIRFTPQTFIQQSHSSPNS